MPGWGCCRVQERAVLILAGKFLVGQKPPSGKVKHFTKLPGVPVFLGRLATAPGREPLRAR